MTDKPSSVEPRVCGRCNGTGEELNTTRSDTTGRLCMLCLGRKTAPLNDTWNQREVGDD